MRVFLLCERIDDGEIVLLRGSLDLRRKRILRNGALISLLGYRFRPHHIRRARLLLTRSPVAMEILRDAGWPAEWPAWMRSVHTAVSVCAVRSEQ